MRRITESSRDDQLATDYIMLSDQDSAGVWAATLRRSIAAGMSDGGAAHALASLTPAWSPLRNRLPAEAEVSQSRERRVGAAAAGLEFSSREKRAKQSGV